MELRLRVPSLRLGWLTLVLMVLLIGFLGLDKSVLHWYVPDADELRADIPKLQGKADFLDSRVDSIAATLSELEDKLGSESTADLVNSIQTEQILRLSSSVAVLSLINAYGGTQSAGSPAGKACVGWFLAGEGSFADCGFQHIETP